MSFRVFLNGVLLLLLGLPSLSSAEGLLGERHARLAFGRGLSLFESDYKLINMAQIVGGEVNIPLSYRIDWTVGYAYEELKGHFREWHEPNVNFEAIARLFAIDLTYHTTPSEPFDSFLRFGVSRTALESVERHQTRDVTTSSIDVAVSFRSGFEIDIFESASLRAEIGYIRVRDIFDIAAALDFSLYFSEYSFATVNGSRAFLDGFQTVAVGVGVAF